MSNVGERFGLLPQPEFKIEGQDGDLIVSRVSIHTMKRNTMRLPIDRERFAKWRASEGLIQNIFPELNAAQREFLISGTTQEEWDDMTGGDEDE
jgi:hypothetical protein